MKKKKTLKGFTLAELLVVVAIIAVVIAVSIPIFMSQMEKARAAVCMSNKRSLNSIIAVQYMTGELKEEDITKEKISLNSDNDYTYDNQTFTCPDGGTIYAQINDLDIEIRCTYHDDEHPTEVKYSAWTAETAGKIWSILKTPNNDIGTCDSSGIGGAGYKKNLNLILGEQQIKLKDLNATSWHLEKNSYFMWTTEDISKMNSGDMVTVMKYNLSGEYAGLYTVWETKVTQITNVDGYTYNIISTSGVDKNSEKTKELSTTEKQDISKVIDIYNENSDGKLEK